jgi:hypothetical protein
LHLRLLVVFALTACALFAQESTFLTWPESKCVQIGKATLRKGSIRGRRTILSTERSHNYKLKATLFTPTMIRAAARLLQIRRHLSDAETLEIVKNAEAAGPVVLVELDPNEGSGVIPSDWHAFLASGSQEVEGKEAAELRSQPVFQGVLGRNYDYDRIWVAFPDFKGEQNGLKLTFEIEGKRETVSWNTSG